MALIDRAYVCRRADGSTVRVNVFDFNLCTMAGDLYVQCEDGSWIRPSRLAVVRVEG